MEDYQGGSVVFTVPSALEKILEILREAVCLKYFVNSAILHLGIPLDCDIVAGDCCE